MIDWNTPGLIDRLRILREGGDTFREIAAKLSSEFGLKIPRAACIGKAGRLGLSVKSVSRPAKPLGQYVIYELSWEICRWPMGEGPPFKYCGDHTFETGNPYCRFHAGISYPHRKFA